MENINFYVYVYLDKRKKGKFVYDEFEFDYEPIYIGKGIRNRINHHIKLIGKKKSLFYNKLNKIIESGYEIYSFKIKENLTEIQSLEIEKRLISLIGRIDIETGTLCNMTEGGESGFTRTSEARLKLSESKIGNKNPMYGKTTSQNQKDKVREIHKLGLIKLSDEGRNKIIESNKNRLGRKYKGRIDAKKYILISPNNEIFYLNGAKKLQEFCKTHKLQYHVLKNNIGIITEENVIGKKINAKNTIGWKINMNLECMD